jgi:hypothetical protein
MILLLNECLGLYFCSKKADWVQKTEATKYEDSTAVHLDAAVILRQDPTIQLKVIRTQGTQND